MKQKWMITFYKNNKICMQRKYLGSFKAAKETAETTIKQYKQYTYVITEL